MLSHVKIGYHFGIEKPWKGGIATDGVNPLGMARRLVHLHPAMPLQELYSKMAHSVTHAWMVVGLTNLSG